MRTMRTMRTAVLIVLAIVAVSLAVAGPAQADDQNVQVNVKLNGFNNGDISAGFVSTDVFDPGTDCKVGTNSGCSASHNYGSPPKNIGNYLCIPDEITYVISENCQSLLSQGSSTGCHSNIVLNSRCGGEAEVSPACNWRTNDNKSQVNWNWSLTLQSGQNGQTIFISVDCSNSNYQGPEEP